MKNTLLTAAGLFTLLCLPASALAQESTPTVSLEADIGEARATLVRRPVSFDISRSILPPDSPLTEVVWNFGDGVRTTGERVNHAYAKPGVYKVSASLVTETDSAEDTTEVRVFEHAAILIADTSVPEEQLKLHIRQAAGNDLFLITLHAKGGGPEVLIEEELTRALVGIQDTLPHARLIITWSSGGVGANVLSRFSQHIRQTERLADLTPTLAQTGVVMLSETPFAVLAPTAQSAFDQLQPAYILLTRPPALELLTKPLSAEQAQAAVFASPLEHRLLGSFSARTVRDIGPTNFLSFGVNYLVNRGVPINSLILILMLPVIATILAFTRQVIGIKSFGLITP
ncbi:MAG: PKD domain-containing protein, partial [Patescibacteria group bacterium]